MLWLHKIDLCYLSEKNARRQRKKTIKNTSTKETSNLDVFRWQLSIQHLFWFLDLSHGQKSIILLEVAIGRWVHCGHKEMDIGQLWHMAEWIQAFIPFMPNSEHTLWILHLKLICIRTANLIFLLKFLWTVTSVSCSQQTGVTPCMVMWCCNLRQGYVVYLEHPLVVTSD